MAWGISAPRFRAGDFFAGLREVVFFAALRDPTLAADLIDLAFDAYLRVADFAGLRRFALVEDLRDFDPVAVLFRFGIALTPTCYRSLETDDKTLPTMGSECVQGRYPPSIQSLNVCTFSVDHGCSPLHEGGMLPLETSL